MANFLKNLGKEAPKARTKALRAGITRRPHELAMFWAILTARTATRPSYTRELPCKGQNQVLEADADTACFITFGD